MLSMENELPPFFETETGFTVEIAGDDWFRVCDPERVCVEVNGLRRAYQAIKERELELLLLRTGECDSTISGLGQ